MLHNGKIKIGDFGFCKSLEKAEMTKTMLGSPIYMAPEILSGMDYDEAVDCWALGILTYKIFNQKFPFESEYKSDMIHQICTSEPKYSEEDSLLNNFIRHLLMKNP